MSSAIKTKDRAYWIKLALVLFIQIFFRFLPNFGSITDIGMAITGIFIGTLVGWCICDPVWPSISCLILMGLTEYSTVTTLLTQMFGNASIVTTIFTFLFSGCVLASGLSDWLGKWFMSRKILKGRPLLITAFFIFVSWLLGPYCGMSLLILLWDITMGIARQLDIDKKYHKYITITIFMLFFNCGVGFYFNWNPGVLSLFGIAQAIDPSALLAAWPFVGYGVVISLLLLFGTAFVLFLVYRPDLSKFKNVEIEAPGPMPTQCKISLLLIVILVISTILPAVLPSTWWLTAQLNKFGTIGALLLVLALAFTIRVDGKPMTTIKQATDLGLAWGPIFIMGTAIIAANALTSDQTGVVAQLTELLTPLFNGMSPFVFAMVIILLTIIFTNFLNNIVVAALFIPIVYSMQSVIGIEPFPLVVTMFYSCYVAVLLPSANPMTAFIFGRGDLIRKSDIFKYAPVAMAVSAVILICIGYPLACLLY